MTINEYQTEALRTAAGMNHPNNDEILLNGVMGLCGESGECVDMVKKYRFQGHELDKAHLAKELGDVAWYLAVTAHAIGYDLETVLQMNVDKLRNRYPNGFEKERSLHRQEGDVRLWQNVLRSSITSWVALFPRRSRKTCWIRGSSLLRQAPSITAITRVVCSTTATW